MDLCVIVLCCGPLRVLRALRELELVGKRRHYYMQTLSEYSTVCLQYLSCTFICLADVHREFQDGSTMLHLACAANNFEAVLYLETSGIDINREDKKGTDLKFKLPQELTDHDLTPFLTDQNQLNIKIEMCLFSTTYKEQNPPNIIVSEM